tara:strand:- start:201 stop:440 length:240 start_codon:yes stop_codon:yes gene_type:complete
MAIENFSNKINEKFNEQIDITLKKINQAIQTDDEDNIDVAFTQILILSNLVRAKNFFIQIQKANKEEKKVELSDQNNPE